MGNEWRIAWIVMGLLVFAALTPASMAASTDVQSGYIVVGLAPAANFDVMYGFNTIPTEVRFVDRSTGSAPLTYQWDFGDGSTSTEINPSHMYINKGTYTVSLTVKNLYGSSKQTKVNAVSIGIAPAADFTAIPITGHVPFIVEFTDRSLGHPATWKWNFGDGQGSSDQNPVHTYWTGGKFTVILTAANDFGSSDASKNEYIIAIPELKSKFTADPVKGNAPLTVKFTDLSIGNPTSWKWNFADDSTSTEQNPVHTFTTAGTYRVVLEITRGGDSDKSTAAINVGGVPVTDFVADQTSVSTTDKIHFTDKSSNSPTKWLWNFGDGSESSEQNPVKTYTVKGIYPVSLFTRNANGRDTEVKTNYINVGMSPVADFFTDTNAYQRANTIRMVKFFDISQNSPASWQWSFGDGQTTSEQNPKHIYSTDGAYTVSLTVKNKFGEDTKVVKDLLTIGDGPKVDFKADKTVVGVMRTVRFTDLSTNSPNTWLWDFGDGTTGTGQNPDHEYRAIGVYDVTLTASNQYNAISQTKKQYITVINIPRIDFVADRTQGQAPFEVRFTEISKGQPSAWKWDFGDGSGSSDKNPVYQYTKNGIYTVSLTATNANGQDTKIKEKYIVVIPSAPVADFKVDQRIGKSPFTVKFRDLSTGNPTKWSWDFGDLTTSTEQNPQHNYAKEGVYDVKLTVWNQYGSDSVLKSSTPGEVLTPVTAAPTPAPVATTEVKATVTTLKPVTPTQAPLPISVVIGTLAISILAVAASRKR